MFKCILILPGLRDSIKRTKDLHNTYTEVKVMSEIYAGDLRKYKSKFYVKKCQKYTKETSGFFF